MARANFESGPFVGVFGGLPRLRLSADEAGITVGDALSPCMEAAAGAKDPDATAVECPS